MEETTRPANLIIRASAGTGKTYQLSSRFLALFARGVPADQILATTFTRKAAGEILDRVVVRLADAVFEGGKLDDLARALGVRSLSHDECLRQLIELLENLHRLRICTLDSFFAQMARGISLEIELPPNWRIVDDWQEEMLRDQALAAVLQRDSTRDLHTLTRLLTKGEASRGVASLLRQTVVNLHEIYHETTAESWQKLKVPKPLSTSDLFAALESLRAIDLTGRFPKVRDEDYSRALQGDWDAFLTRGLPAKILGEEMAYYRKPIPDDLVECYQPLLRHARAEVIGRVARQTEGSYQLLANFDQEYSRIKRQQGVMRFHDLTHRLASLAESRDDTGARLAFRLDGRIEHVLLDEFQDTAPPQWRALESLARQVANEHAENRSFFCVGDVKQAIYGWRGGVAEIFEAIEAQLPEVESTTLEMSYRSSSSVIETVNRIFEGLTRHPNLERHEQAVANWCTRFNKHQTALADMPGYATLRTGPVAVDGLSGESACLSAATDLAEKLLREAPQASIGMLVRTNASVGQLIHLLRRRSIHASEEGGNPLTDSAAVKLILALLELADNPDDSVARFAVATSPLGPLFGLDNHATDQSAVRTSRFVRRALADNGYPALVAQCIASFSGSVSPRERSRLDQLLELTNQFQPHASSRTRPFRRFVAQQRVTDPTTANVRVMTIHQSKGLEFDVVILADLDSPLVGQPKPCVVHRPSPTERIDLVCQYTNVDVQRLLPAEFQQMFHDDSARTLSESLCVLYVALTRAAHALYMIVPPSTATEKQVPKRYSGMLRAALTDGERVEPEQTLYECGDPEWYHHVAPPAPPPAAVTPTATEKTGKIVLARAHGTLRNFERVAPSQLEGGTVVRVDQVLTPESRGRFERGLHVHAMFECIEWLDDPVPEPSVLAGAAQKISSMPLDAASNDTIRAEFLAALQQPTIARVLRRSFYDRPEGFGLTVNFTDWTPTQLKVHNEFPFSAKLGERIVSGNIDRLILIYQDNQLIAANVIDFKTDRIGPEQLIERVDFYRPQVAAYRDAVCALTGLAPECVSSCLLFVALDQVHYL